MLNLTFEALTFPYQRPERYFAKVSLHYYRLHLVPKMGAEILVFVDFLIIAVSARQLHKKTSYSGSKIKV